MLTTPNMQSSGNDNDSSDDFSIINTPSPQPQPPNDSNNNKLTSSISQLKESEEVDDFEHLSMMNVAKTPNSNDNDSNTSAEQSDFDLIDIALKESPSDRDPITAEAARDSVDSDQIDKPSKVIQPSENPASEPEDNIIGETVKSTVNLTDIKAEEYGEQKIETLQLSPSISARSESSSPKATMDEIVTLTEPFNSSLSSANDAVSDGQIFVNHDQEHQPLIEAGVKGRDINDKKRKNRHLKKEYERYVLDQRSDERAGLNGFLCCKYNNLHDTEQQVDEARDFFDSIACIVDFLGGYVDKCFGADQFNDDCGPRKPYKQI